MREHGELLEWAEVHGNFYGTPRAPVEKALAEGRDVLFDIDWQGTRAAFRDRGAAAGSRPRLRPAAELWRAAVAAGAARRGRAETIRRRLANARIEIGKWGAYDYVIVNDDLDRLASRGRAPSWRPSG